jgi:hypothetical protein
LLANDELLPIRLPDHWMRNAFSVHFLLDAQDNDNALTVLRACNEAFPRSSYFLAQHALIHYNLRGEHPVAVRLRTGQGSKGGEGALGVTVSYCLALRIRSIFGDV